MALAERREAEMRMLMSHAWHVGAFSRAKRLPPFDRVVGKQGIRPKTPEDLIKTLKAQFGAKEND